MVFCVDKNLKDWLLAGLSGILYREPLPGLSHRKRPALSGGSLRPDNEQLCDDGEYHSAAASAHTYSTIR